MPKRKLDEVEGLTAFSPMQMKTHVRPKELADPRFMKAIFDRTLLLLRAGASKQFSGGNQTDVEITASTLTPLTRRPLLHGACPLSPPSGPRLAPTLPWCAAAAKTHLLRLQADLQLRSKRFRIMEALFDYKYEKGSSGVALSMTQWPDLSLLQLACVTLTCALVSTLISWLLEATHLPKGSPIGWIMTWVRNCHPVCDWSSFTLPKDGSRPGLVASSSPPWAHSNECGSPSMSMIKVARTVSSGNAPEKKTLKNSHF